MSVMSGIYFTPYRVSTITCNANIGDNVNLDLNTLFHKIEIDNRNDSFIWIQFLKEKEEQSRGVYPKKKRKTKTEGKNRFDNQMTVIYKFNDEYMPNIKIFKNGNIQLTGIKDVLHPKIIIDRLIQNIKRIYETDKNVINSGDTTDNTNITDNLSYKNFKIRMINTDFKIYEKEDMANKFNIKRKELHNILISERYSNKSSFQPGIYQGVKLEYFWNSCNTEKDGICKCSGNCFGKNSGNGNGNCKKVTIAIFESGSILITGGITFEQVNDAYAYICRVISENKDVVKKQLNTELQLVF